MISLAVMSIGSLLVITIFIIVEPIISRLRPQHILQVTLKLFEQLARMSFSKVPVLDFSRFSNEGTKEEELSKLKEAIFEVGFLYLSNTGIDVRVTIIAAGFSTSDAVIIGYR